MREVLKGVARRSIEWRSAVVDAEVELCLARHQVEEAKQELEELGADIGARTADMLELVEVVAEAVAKWDESQSQAKEEGAGVGFTKVWLRPAAKVNSAGAEVRTFALLVEELQERREVWVWATTKEGMVRWSLGIPAAKATQKAEVRVVATARAAAETKSGELVVVAAAGAMQGGGGAGRSKDVS